MSPADLELADGESLVAPGSELLYRQITKHLLDPHGQVATHAFTGPSSADGKPSYSRASIVTAQESRDWHSEHSKSPSLLVHAVTVDEVVEARRWAIDDSGSEVPEGRPRSPGHCYVDARKLDKVTLKSLRAELWEAAMSRGEVPTADASLVAELELE